MNFQVAALILWGTICS